MKVVCVLVPHFPLAVERRERPGLRGKPVIIGGYPHERGKRVLDASEECLKVGVMPGMLLWRAHKLCAAVFLPADDERYRAIFEKILVLLAGFGQAVEVGELGCAYLDAAGLNGSHGDDASLTSKIARTLATELGLEAQIGLGPGKFVARAAASLARPNSPRLISAGAQRDFLDPLPVDWLPLSPAIQQKLHLLGFKQIGQLAELPRATVAQRFGTEGALAHKLARGEDERGVRPRPHSSLPDFSITMR
ncbi:MAG: hypothetical protein M1358_21655 [Chloroflexi bacterium]|nr:hypothetical protein [Chloroflexota bacterium]